MCKSPQAKSWPGSDQPERNSRPRLIAFCSEERHVFASSGIRTQNSSLSTHELKPLNHDVMVEWFKGADATNEQNQEQNLRSSSK